jgi:uncharacterized protein (DUF433 family)
MAGVEFRPEPVTSRAPSAGGVPLFTEFEPPIVDDADERRALPWPLLLRATRCKQIPGLPWLCSVPAVRPYHSAMAFERITVDPQRMGGVPCVRDLRVTVSMVLGQLAAGASFDEVLADYPYLEPADIPAVLEYAAAVVNEREVPIARPA